MLQVNDIFPDINPAFCSIILSQFCLSYQSKAHNGVDYRTIFYVLPLSMSRDYDSFFYKKQSKSDFFKILSENVNVIVGLPERVKGCFAITRGAFLFSLAANDLFFDERRMICASEMAVKRLAKAKKIKKIVPYLRKASLLGEWLGRNNSPETLFSYIGAVK